MKNILPFIGLSFPTFTLYAIPFSAVLNGDPNLLSAVCYLTMLKKQSVQLLDYFVDLLTDPAKESPSFLQPPFRY